MISSPIEQIPVRTVLQGSVPFNLSAPDSDDQPADSHDLYVLKVKNSGYRQAYSPPILQEHTLGFPVSGNGLIEGKVGSRSARFRYGLPGTGLALVPAGVNSTWRMKGDNTYLSVFLSQAAISLLAIGSLDIDASHVELIPSLFFTDGLIYYLGMTISQEFSRKGPLDLLYLESLSQTLAMHLVRHYSCAPTSRFSLRGKLSNRSLKQITEYIASMPLEYLKIRNLAGLVNLSPFHFERLFRSATGKTVHQYALEQQLKKSVDLLLRSDLSIAQIATDLGFADQAHFGRHFKAFYGLAPSELRKDSKILQKSPHENSS